MRHRGAGVKGFPPLAPAAHASPLASLGPWRGGELKLADLLILHLPFLPHYHPSPLGNSLKPLDTFTRKQARPQALSSLKPSLIIQDAFHRIARRRRLGRAAQPREEGHLLRPLP